MDVTRLIASFDLASSTIMIWDYVLTFGMEVDLVWNSEWNFIKGLYLFQRYLPFIDIISIALYYQIGGSLTKTGCQNLYYATAVTTVLGLAASEMLLTYRTWAVWNRNQRLSIILPILYALVWGSGFVVLSIFLKSITFGDPPYPGFKSCFLMHSNKDLVFLWALLIIWDTLMMILMLVPAFRAYRSGGNSTLIKVVYRDGVIYYLYLFVLSSTNVVVVKSLPTQHQHLLTSMERMLHSILTSRILLHIRALTKEKPVTELSTIAFPDRVTEFNS